MKQIIGTIVQVPDSAVAFFFKYFWIIIPSVCALLIFSVTIVCVFLLLKKNKETEPLPYRNLEEKMITILSVRFSSFLSFGEKAGAADVFPLLNEYITFVRNAAHKTGGAVELFTDGSLIAYWGEDDSSGSPAHDALNAVRAAMIARFSLAELNNKRKEAGELSLYIVVGISSGKMFTGLAYDGVKTRRFLLGEPGIIAVKARNAADREKTDIVISAKTWRLVKDYIIAEELPALPAAGGEPVRLFAIVNMRAAAGTKQPPPVTLSELRKGLYSASG